MARSTKGALRLARLSDAIVRVGGIGTGLFGRYVLYGTKQVVCRTFAQMVDIGAVTKHQVIATPTSVWLTRKAWVRERYANEVAGDRFVNGSKNGPFGPYPAFDHDRTADRFVYAMFGSCSGNFLTQHEVDKLKHLWIGRRPDAVLLLTIVEAPGRARSVVGAVEVEESDKSGVNGGWMHLGGSIVNLCARSGYPTSLGEITDVVVVANSSRAKSIAKKVLDAYLATDPEDRPEEDDVFWFWCEIREDGSFGPVRKWRMGEEEPDPGVCWVPWNPERMPRHW